MINLANKQTIQSVSETAIKAYNMVADSIRENKKIIDGEWTTLEVGLWKDLVNEIFWREGACGYCLPIDGNPEYYLLILNTAEDRKWTYDSNFLMHTQGIHDKFWTIRPWRIIAIPENNLYHLPYLKASGFITHWGKVGSLGTCKSKGFATSYRTGQEQHKLYISKTAKGYLQRFAMEIDPKTEKNVKLEGLAYLQKLYENILFSAFLAVDGKKFTYSTTDLKALNLTGLQNICNADPAVIEAEFEKPKEFDSFIHKFNNLELD